MPFPKEENATKEGAKNKYPQSVYKQCPNL